MEPRLPATSLQTLAVSGERPAVEPFRNGEDRPDASIPSVPCAKLVVTRPDGEHLRSERLHHSLTLIGSRKGCRVRLRSAGVSPVHCAVLQTGGQIILRDLISKTGTKVSGSDDSRPGFPDRLDRLEDRSYTLKQGDQFRIHRWCFTVDLEEPVGLRRLTATRRGALPVGSPLNGSAASLRLHDAEDRLLHRSCDSTILIGRHARCDLSLSDHKVSGTHALIFRRGDVWLIADLLSANGTRVNDQPLDNCRSLAAGDFIEVGSTRLTVHLERAGDHLTEDADNGDGESECAADRTASPGCGADGEITRRVPDALERSDTLESPRTDLLRRLAAVEQREASLQEKDENLQARDQCLRLRMVELERDERRATRRIAGLDQRETDLRRKSQSVEQTEAAQRDRQAELEARAAAVVVAERRVERDVEQLDRQLRTLNEDRAEQQRRLEELDAQREELLQRERAQQQRASELASHGPELREQKRNLSRQARELKSRLAEVEAALHRARTEDQRYAKRLGEVERREQASSRQRARLWKLAKVAAEKHQGLVVDRTSLGTRERELGDREAKLAAAAEGLAARERDLTTREDRRRESERIIAEIQARFETWQNELSDSERVIRRREATLQGGV